MGCGGQYSGPCSRPRPVPAPWDMYQVMLGGLKWFPLLILTVKANQAPVTGGSLAQHSGSRLCNEATPLLQRPQSTHWGSIPSVIGHWAPLISPTPTLAHTVQNDPTGTAKNDQNHPLPSEPSPWAVAANIPAYALVPGMSHPRGTCTE